MSTYEPAQPGRVDFVLEPGYVAPAWDQVDFFWESGGPIPGSSQRYASVRAVWARARAQSARPVQSGYRASPRVDRRSVARFAAASARLDGTVFSGWDWTGRVDRAAGTHWQAASPQDAWSLSGWCAVFSRDVVADAPWASATARDPLATWSAWLRVWPRDARSAAPWQAAKLPAVLLRPAQYVIERHGVGIANPPGDRLMALLPERVQGPWDDVLLREELVYQPIRAPRRPNFRLDQRAGEGGDILLTGRPAYVPPDQQQISATLRGRYTPPPAMWVRVELGHVGVGFELVAPAPYVQQHRDADPVGLHWGDPPARQVHNTLPWGPRGRYPGRDPIIELPWVEPPDAPPPQPPALRVHIVLNTVSVVRLPDRAPIDVADVELSSSVDSPYWSVRMTLANPSHLALLRPTAAGPAQVEITMNTYVWTAIIEGRDARRQFANAGAAVVGRSRSALLDDPYAPARSREEVAVSTARQLAEFELANTGYALGWAGVDWLVPPGAWYYQDLSPMQAIQRIAGARGAVVQSDPATEGVRVAARYPVSPWAWDATVPDIVLPDSWVTEESARMQSRPLFDAVIVTGEQQGVLARVVRAGAAGETFAPQVVDQLITHADVAAERGRIAIADRGEQELIEKRIPLFPPGTITGGGPGLYEPLRLVEVQEASQAWKGLSVGVTIRAAREGFERRGLEIWQNVTIERHLTDAR